MTAIRWWIIFGIAILPFLVIPGLGESYVTTKAIGLSVVTSTALLVVSGLILKHGDRDLITRWMRVPSVQAAAGFLAVLLLVWGIHGFSGYALWGSFLRSEGIWFSVLIVMFSVVGLMVFHMQKHWNTLWLVLSGVGVLLVILEVLARIGLPVPGVVGQGAYASLFGNSSFFAGYLLVALWFVRALWKSVESALMKKVSVGFGVVIVFGLVMTQSRAAMLGLVASVVVTGVVLAYRKMRSGNAKQKKNAIYQLSVVGALIVVYALMQIPAIGGALPRAVVVSPTALTSQTRLLHWGAGASAFVDNPVFGWGPGGYATAAAAHINTDIFALSPSDTVIDDPHNVFIRRFVEGGAVLGLAYVMVYVAMIMVAFRLWKRHKSEHNDSAAMIIAAAVGYAVYSLFSIEHILVELVFWTVIGWVIFVDMQTQPERGVGNEKVRPEKVVGYGTAAVGVITVFVVLIMIPAVNTAKQAATAVENRQWFTWVEKTEAALGSEFAPYSCAVWDQQTTRWLAYSALENSVIPHDVFEQAGVLLSQGGEECGNDVSHFLPAWRSAQLDTRLSDMTIAVTRNDARQRWNALLAAAPDHAYLHFGLVESYLDNAEYAQALEQLQSYRELHPGVPQTYDMLALVYRLAGDVESSAAILEQKPE